MSTESFAEADPDPDALLDAILPHVAFDGWSETAFHAAAADLGLDPRRARALCPRGAVGLAIAFHQRGDRRMVEALEREDLSALRFRDRVARAIRLRLDAAGDKEAVRRGSTLFSLPHMAPEGARLVWGTVDRIWQVLGDPSEDLNWYTKRMTLAGVYASTVLFWLGDDSLDGQATDAFIDRRIGDVMQVEKLKARANANPLLKPMTGPLGVLAGAVRRPAGGAGPDPDLPGHWRRPTGP